ncbi:hypothetical protein F53441_9965 [Fusarium austroafricanum]|uniref:Uncharacterized protein n=1 Tax=Fusarium austroafricanum TaxID=2364996 RepID=A0A8H4K9U0_9HYPO|nr:hypothetical protein F53441_9965 [Fusarium austroafricanum]
MEEPPKKRRLLFVDTNGGDFASRPNRKKLMDSRVRRHVMVDIGKSRRKPSKDRQFVTLLWQTQRNTHSNEDSKSGNDDNLQALAKDFVAPDTAAFVAPYAIPRISYTLSTLEKEWGEDSFSAYGFTLIMAVGKNSMGPTHSTDTFWFPFAFRKSAFLRHYQQMFASPDVLIPLYHRSARELTSLALERSLMTIQCVESRLASADKS